MTATIKELPARDQPIAEQFRIVALQWEANKLKVENSEITQEAAE
jgi:hypothetical protein